MTFFRFQAVLASKLAPTWVPKTGPKPTQNLTNRLQISTSLQDAPKMAPKLEKHPKIGKNLQKWYQHGRIMGSKFYQNSCQKRLQGKISWELENIQKCATVGYNNTTLIASWDPRTPYCKVSPATSTVSQGVRVILA